MSSNDSLASKNEHKIGDQNLFQVVLVIINIPIPDKVDWTLLIAR